jgi:beta-lactamase superfamily II metal-dependent hydrolase
MKVTFKDVGQGDSILLEWQVDGNPKIGIIDCNRKDGKNPVAEYIDQSDYTEIEFIILSHPHSDHYSGMVQLLEIVEKKGITVIRFAHSLYILGKDFYKYLNWVEIETAALKDLQTLVAKVDVLRKMDIIKMMESLVENWRIDLNDDIYLKCLSPSQLEAEKYMEIVSLEPEKNKKAASKGANFLSTVFKLTLADKYYLFTSDSEPFTLERILKQGIHKNLQKKSLKIGQMPHHGSEKNHVPDFWDFLTKDKDPDAVVSAGVHLKYNHPNFPVIKSFHENGYRIYATNNVNGMEEYFEFLKKLAIANNSLDTFSELIDTYTEGDQIF